MSRPRERRLCVLVAERARAQEGGGEVLDLVRAHQPRVRAAFVKGRGVEESVDPALVANRADIVALAADRAPTAETHEVLAGWRGAFVGADLVRLLRGEIYLRLDPDRGLPVVIHF